MNGKRITRAFERYRDRGDAKALAKVFDALAPDLLRVATHLAPSAAEAEDLVQTTFLLAMERRTSFDSRGPVGAWIHGILWREARDGDQRRRDRAVADGRRECIDTHTAALHLTPDVWCARECGGPLATVKTSSSLQKMLRARSTTSSAP